MKTLVLKNSDEVAKKAASILLQQIKNKPQSNLGLATGQTMIPIYKELCLLINNKKLNLSKIKTFNVDEYHTLPITDKNSYHYYMNNLLFKHININPSNIFFPQSLKPSNYDKLIKKAGGIDMMILGIGSNGHIAFNEPGCSIKSNTCLSFSLCKIFG